MNMEAATPPPIQAGRPGPGTSTSIRGFASEKVRASGPGIFWVNLAETTNAVDSTHAGANYREQIQYSNSSC